MNISDYFESNFLENFNLKHEQNLSLKIEYYNNAKSDAIHCYKSIEKYLHKKIKKSGGGGSAIVICAEY